ncbi:MAG: carbamoyltransferase HypF [Hormoscilla sp.]
MVAEEIRIGGTVQGVGFRPTVYRLAKALGLRGEVRNDEQGVLIRVAGTRPTLDLFLQQLRSECPPLANIETISRQPYGGECNFTDFIIAPSTSSSTSTIKTKIVPDAATCPSCKKEIFDPFTRWYRYPFTNCTHCGPRLSIIKKLPYDRPNTSMASFSLCPDCQGEYADPENRRFHAQPIACHVCGPKAWLERTDGKPITAAMFSMLDDVDAVCTLLQKGEIVAIKGLGGFHLACDATNDMVVQKLRSRKGRYHKPFALMARDIDIIAEYCTINERERELLQSPAAPIVLMETTGQKAVAPSVAPGQNSLGFMLPYTPLHHLILKRMDRPIVLTSGNKTDEPQCIDNDTARDKLGGIADYFLLHDREIVNRIDDSVVRAMGDRPQILRRARGYAPAPINLPPGFSTTPDILAMGGELKNTFCLIKDGQAILSQHLGDLENPIAFSAYQDTINLYLDLFEHNPVALAIDRHPEYLSSKLGKELAATNKLPCYHIQHHHAHLAACMVENGVPLDEPPVLGIALDGLGYGEDGTIWGGEFLLASYRGFQRLATFKPVAMLGGTQAIYQPWRNTYAHLRAAFNWTELKQQYGDLELLAFLDKKPRQLLDGMMAKGINSPLASSCGRLFDGVAAALGICREACSYEGQAAIELEAIAAREILNNSEEDRGYPWDISKMVAVKEESCRGIENNLYCLELQLMWKALLEDLQQQRPKGAIAARFHQGLATSILAMVDRLRQGQKVDRVALTGGVFQNRILLDLVSRKLTARGLTVLTHSLVPPNDGGLSLGQGAIAAARYISG